MTLIMTMVMLEITGGLNSETAYGSALEYPTFPAR